MNQLLNVATVTCALQRTPSKTFESVNRDNSQKAKPTQPPVPVIFFATNAVKTDIRNGSAKHLRTSEK